MSLADYQEKIATRFDTFDRDGDGAVTVADFDALAVAILDEYGLSEDSPKGRRLMSGAEHFWSSLSGMADMNADTGVSREEFVEAATTYLYNDRAAFQRMVQPWASAVIAVADADDDGQVTVPEWERMLRAMRATPERAHAKAAALDADHDGVITLDEVLESAVRFYTADEPSRDFAMAR
ncbi:EF-hand domain-containing protein [Streptomyces sp. NPDC050803]|uniref:EF-hand domain-containing protein n=1 Tax=unclassified Streptomyces TaxID=2593676 RepID=UPI003428AE72